MPANQFRNLTRVITFVLFLSPLAMSAVTQTQDARPNIILVMTDDQGYGDLHCHGHPYIKTPNLDKLHSQSTRFTDFHVSPTCAPTRAALLSGRAPFKNGVTHTILEREHMAPSATTLAEVLKATGYATGIFGKWHLGDADAYQPDRRGFDEVFIHGSGAIGESFPGTQGSIPGTGYFDPILKHNGTFVQSKGYCTDVFFAQALSWIHQHRKQPFFAYIPTNAPHLPYLVGDKYKALYQDKCPDATARFFGMITNIDENMGRLMTKLDDWGLAENTLLIFMSDNGTSGGVDVYNAGMKGKKGTLHQGGSRVPLFMRLPGKIKAGVDVHRLTRHYELYEIDKDPGERNNVAAEHPKIVHNMLKAYYEWWDEVRPMMINEDASLDTGKPFIERFNRQKKAQGIPLWKPAPTD